MSFASDSRGRESFQMKTTDMDEKAA